MNTSLQYYNFTAFHILLVYTQLIPDANKQTTNFTKQGHESGFNLQ